MAGRLDQATQTAAIARMAGSAALAPAIREELQVVLASPVFGSSHRAQRFLRHIVEQALAGQFDQLKERMIGVELFGREAAYDTNQDSIVRVTATDVRKRLAEYYSASGRVQRIRIGLPQGSYIPEIEASPEAAPVESAPDGPVAPLAEAVQGTELGRPKWPVLCCALLLLICAALALQNLSLRNPALPPEAGTLPWSVLFAKDRRTYLVTSDTAFAALQDLVKTKITLADYAGRRYPPAEMLSAPGLQDAAQLLLRNQFTASADATIAASISHLASVLGGQMAVASAKTMQVRSFHTRDNFILLGSSYANPWVDLFAARMGLTIDYEPAQRKQICRDRRAQRGQQEAYVPTALTGGTGHAFATITLLRNTGQTGWVLLLSGTNMEGTEAAAELALDAARLTSFLQRAKIDPTHPAEFELLLKLNSFAGAANSTEIVLARAIH